MSHDTTDPTSRIIAITTARAATEEEIAETLQALEAVTLIELPDGDARAALVEAICAGVVDDVYRFPLATYHNLSIYPSDRCGYVRRTVAEWIYAYDHGEIEQLLAGQRISSDPPVLTLEEWRKVAREGAE